MAKAKPREVGSIARIVFGILSGMARSRADSLPPSLLFRIESPSSLCDPLRDLLALAAKERTDGNPKGGLVSKAGLKRGRTSPGLIARHLHARRGAEEIGKPRLSQMRVAAISAEVIIKWPSVKVCHGSTKNRRLAGSSVESELSLSGKFSGAGRLTEEYVGEQTTHPETYVHIIL